jgi:hypothetical protein
MIENLNDTITKEEFLDSFTNETLKERAYWADEMAETVIEKAQEDANDHLYDWTDPGVNLNYVKELHEWIEMLGDKKRMLLISEMVNRAIEEPDPIEEEIEIEEPTAEEVVTDQEEKEQKVNEKELKQSIERLQELCKKQGISGKIGQACMKALLSAMLMKKMNDDIELVNMVADTYDNMLLEEVKKEVASHE